MANIFLPSKLTNLCLYIVLITFSMAVIVPVPVYAQNNINNVVFGLRIEKLVEKMWKYQRKMDGDKIIETMLEIKHEIEIYTGKAIDLDKEFDKVEATLQKKNNIPKKDIKAVRKAIVKKEKKLHHRALCMAYYLQDAPSLSFEEYETLFNISHGNEQETQQAKDLPLRLTIGITMMLAGGFLCMAGVYLVMPPCVYAGEQLLLIGAGFAADSYVGFIEDDKKK